MDFGQRNFVNGDVLVCNAPAGSDTPPLRRLKQRHRFRSKPARRWSMGEHFDLSGFIVRFLQQFASRGIRKGFVAAARIVADVLCSFYADEVFAARKLPLPTLRGTSNPTPFSRSMIANSAHDGHATVRSVNAAIIFRDDFT
jgi:hypothetical protein